VPPRDVQRALRTVFERWGLPERVRVDNGWPWGSSSDLPPFLALWLLGLEVGVIHNPPRRPQHNAKVERFHGLVEPWGEPGTCPNYSTWQAQLSWLSQVQRERYPSVGRQSGGKQTRVEAFPSLMTTKRPYTSAQEPELWSLDRVKTYLMQGRWRRHVDKVGRITLYHRPYGVGRRYKSQEVFVSFEPATTAWVVQDKTGQAICRQAAREITVDVITNLEVSHHRHVPSIENSGQTS
jgi:hypothetical protein